MQGSLSWLLKHVCPCHSLLLFTVSLCFISHAYLIWSNTVLHLSAVYAPAGVFCCYWVDCACSSWGWSGTWPKGCHWGAATRAQKAAASPSTSNTKCLVLTLVLTSCRHGDGDRKFSKWSPSLKGRTAWQWEMLDNHQPKDCFFLFFPLHLQR